MTGDTDRRWRSGLLLLLLVRLILGIVYSSANPLGEAPDEADHYAYVVYIGQEGRLPEGTAVTQGKHPPLYYLLAAAVARPAGLDFSFLRANPDVGVTADALAPNFFIHTAQEAWPWREGPLAMHLARWVSVLAGLLLVLATYGLGRGLWPARPEIALASAAFVAFLPESLFVGGSVSNDMLAAALSALALWWAVGGRGWLAAFGTGVALGLGFLTKASVVAIWPIAGLALLVMDGWRVRRPFQHLDRLVVVAAVATAIAAPWLWRNWTLYGDLMGTPVVLGTIDQRQAPLDLAWLGRGWFLSFWGKFGGAGHISLRWPHYALWSVIVIGAVAGGVRTAYFARRSQDDESHLAAVRWIVLAGAPLLAMLSMLGYSQIALGTDQGRLLFPALAPFGLLIAAGWAGWLPVERSAGQASSFAALFSAALLVAALLAFVTGIGQSFAPPLATSAEVAAAAAVGQEMGGLELAAAEWNADGAATGLTLYWRAAGPVNADLRTILRLYGEGDALLWEWKRSPGAGRYSTDRWLAGEMFADPYRVPVDPGTVRRAEVILYAFPDETPLGRAELPLPEPAGGAEGLSTLVCRPTSTPGGFQVGDFQGGDFRANAPVEGCE